MRTISYRSMRELNSLETNGFLEKDNISINLGLEPIAIATLQILIKKYKEDNIDTSVSGAGDIVEKINSLSRDIITKETDAEYELHTDDRRKSWRIVELKAQNFRGLTDFDGDEFFIKFDGKPFILFGSNGSGKTSILSAIAWCFTGMCIKERCEPDDEASCGIKLFEKNDATTPLISDWPFVMTIPYNKTIQELTSLTPSCTVKIKVVDEKGKTVWVKRTISKGTQSSFTVFSNDSEKINWQDLEINDLDLELSLLMPARTMNIRFEPGSKISENLISVAGLDTLLELGGATRRLAGSVARYKTREESKASDLRKDAAAIELGTKTDENQKIWIEIDKAYEVLQKQKDESDDGYRVRVLEKQVKMLTEKASTEFQIISDKIGVTPKTHQERKDLIDDLRQARIKIGKSSEDWETLKDWRLITNEMIQNSSSNLKKMVKKLSSDLKDQYDTWLENKKRKGILSVKNSAATYCKEEDNFEICPVCEQKLPDDIVKELRSLAEQKEKLIDNLKHHVRDLSEMLASSIPMKINNLSTSLSAKEQLRNIIIQNIWSHIKPLGKVKEEVGSMVKTLIESLPEQKAIDKHKVFVEEDWDKNFIEHIKELENLVISYNTKLSIAKWIENNIHKIDSFLDDHIFKESDKNDKVETKSLISDLKTLENYAERFQNIDTIRSSLFSTATKFSKADSHRINAEKANIVHKYLGKLKNLDKYATILLNNELDSVSAEMKEFYSNLYPSGPVNPGKIASQKSRAGTKPDYRFRLQWSDELLVDAEPVANLGRIRALLWSFAFALIKKYAPALKTILIDDPVISLDDYHAQNMVENIIAQQLAGEYQPIATIHQEHLLHERWGRDPYGENIGFAKVLTRDEKHRNCRLQPSWEPLAVAINNFNNDRDKWSEVTKEARIALENHLKTLAPYLTTTDVSTKTLDSIINILKQARDAQKNATNICPYVNVGALINIYEEETAKIVLQIGLHGGQDRSRLGPFDADQIASGYPKWLAEINKRYIEIEKALIRKTTKTAIVIDSFVKPEPIKNILTELKLDNPIYEVGAVAAEGNLTVFAGDSSEMKLYSWFPFYCGILTGYGCRPLAWEGQIVLFAENLPISNGDMALMQTKDNNFLRRVYEIPINESETGWVGVSINPTLYHIEPEFFSREEISLCKFVGVLFPDENERITNAKLPGGEVISHTGAWPSVLKSLAKGNFHLIKVKGNSAEPLAIDGQYLVIEKTDIFDKSLSMMPCCVVLSDNRSLFKRLCISVDTKNRVLLQPFNVAEPHPVIEATLLNKTDENEFETSNLPTIEQLFLVRGVLIDNPELIAQKMDLT